MARAHARFRSKSSLSVRIGLRFQEGVKLFEVVTKVRDVILHQEPKRDNAIRPIPRLLERRRRRNGNDVSQVPVIGSPQGHNVTKRHLRVLLAGDPIILVVPLKDDRRLVAADHEPPVVVARRIHQVAEDLPGAPAAVARPLGRAGFVHVVKEVEGVADDGVQIGGDGGWRHLAWGGEAPEWPVARHMIQMTGIRNVFL